MGIYAVNGLGKGGTNPLFNKPTQAEKDLYAAAMKAKESGVFPDFGQASEICDMSGNCYDVGGSNNPVPVAPAIPNPDLRFDFDLLPTLITPGAPATSLKQEIIARPKIKEPSRAAKARCVRGGGIVSGPFGPYGGYACTKEIDGEASQKQFSELESYCERYGNEIDAEYYPSSCEGPVCPAVMPPIKRYFCHAAMSHFEPEEFLPINVMMPSVPGQTLDPKKIRNQKILLLSAAAIGAGLLFLSRRGF